MLKHRSPSREARSVSREAPGDQRGFTLQALVITAVLVVVAVVASVLIVAISRSSGTRLEDAGKAEVEGLCRSWEVHKATLAAKGYGGTQGYGGVFSSNIGCIAVCYLRVIDGNEFYPTARTVANRGAGTLNNYANVGWGRSPDLRSVLEYDDSNRVPGRREVRLGVAYNRVAPDDVDDPDEFWPDFGYYRHAAQRSDVSRLLFWRARDPDPIIRMIGASGTPGQRADWPGTPIPLEFRGETHTRRWSKGMPWSASLHVYEPNFWSPGHANFRDRDEEWEVRAHPGREVCEIVDTANNDEIMLTSAFDCDSGGIPQYNNCELIE